MICLSDMWTSSSSRAMWRFGLGADGVWAGVRAIAAAAATADTTEAAATAHFDRISMKTDQSGDESL